MGRIGNRISWVYSHNCSVEIAILSSFLWFNIGQSIPLKEIPRKYLGNIAKLDVAGCECDVNVGWSREGVSSSQLRSEPINGKSRRRPPPELRPSSNH